MDIRPSLLSSIFANANNWKLHYNFPELDLEYDAKFIKLNPEQITEIQLQKGWIWSSLIVKTINQEFVIKGVLNSQAIKFKMTILDDAAFIENKKNAETIKAMLQPYLLQFQTFLDQNTYLSHREINSFKAEIEKKSKVELEKFDRLYQRDQSFAFEPNTQILFEQLKNFITLSTKTNQNLINVNHQFIEKQLEQYKNFFDEVESTPLTEEQRISAIIFEDRNLLVAAAGSGKTSTIVGKVGYALLTKQYRPEDILVLAFNRNAGEELNERINHRLKDLLAKSTTKIEALNFHQLGVRIIGKATGKSPTVSNHAGKIQYLLNEIIEQLLQQDPEFQQYYLLFKTAYLKSPLSPFTFKTQREWDKAQRQSFDRFKDGFETYKGDIVKSHGEKAIANWLFSQGIPYEYEKNYEQDTADEQHRQYKPDFYFPDINLYLEHYAVDQYGQPPAVFGQKYLDEMKWKEETHRKYKTDLIFTTFHEFITGTIFHKLEQELKARGQAFNPLSLNQIMDKAKTIYEHDANDLFGTFLNHYKSNQADIHQLLAIPSLTQREQLFLKLFAKIYEQYEKALESNNEYDFEDLLIESAQLIQANQYKSPYKLIIVDEFQDTSQARARLILALLKQIPEAKLFCVGDDWQAIYRFAGSDISIFTQFEKVFGYTKQTQLTQTFRSNQGIANIASRLIQKNPAQLKKVVNAIDPTVRQVVEIFNSSSNESIQEYIVNTLIKINNENQHLKKKKTVFILGRYKQNEPNLSRVKPLLQNCTITFRTIHSSKGLQADFVILVGLNKGNSAFPSEREDDPLLNMVLPRPETYPFAEERRLLYVALTRAKEKVYLIGEKDSVFLDEIAEDSSLKDFIYYFKAEQRKNDQGHPINDDIPEEWRCPKCSLGRLWKRSGKFGEFMACNRYPDCSYTRNLKKAS